MNIAPEAKILIIRLSALGDVIRTLPALRALRSAFPSAYIAWVVEESSRDLLEGHPDLNQLFVFKRRRWSSGLRSLKGVIPSLREIREFVREIRGEGFDVVLDFHGIFKSGVISFISGSPLRVGFSREFTKEFNYLFNNYHVRLQTDAVSRIQRNLNFLRYLGVEGNDIEPVIPITPEDERYIADFFALQGLDTHSPLIAIHPGTSKKTSYKRWSLSSYALVADELVEKVQASIIWTWGPGEGETVAKIVQQMTHPSVIACEMKNLRQLAELFRRCALFLGSDSGPLHLASFMKTPVVALFGPTDPIVNAPYQKNPHLVIRKDVPCSPCRKRSCQDKKCMYLITPDEVIEAVLTFLEERRTPL